MINFLSVTCNYSDGIKKTNKRKQKLLMEKLKFECVYG